MNIQNPSPIVSNIAFTFNGAPANCPYGCSLVEFIESLDLDVRTVAIERNLEIVARSIWSETLIAQDDNIELVQFVGGG